MQCFVCVVILVIAFPLTCSVKINAPSSTIHIREERSYQQNDEFACSNTDDCIADLRRQVAQLQQVIEKIGADGIRVKSEYSPADACLVLITICVVFVTYVQFRQHMPALIAEAVGREINRAMRAAMPGPVRFDGHRVMLPLAKNRESTVYIPQCETDVEGNGDGDSPASLD